MKNQGAAIGSDQIEITGTLTLDEKIYRKYEELVEKVDSILKKKKNKRASIPDDVSTSSR
jgi:uncharacterized small protein (DUF1192 family)